MANRKEKSLRIRFFSSACSITLIGTFIFILVSGFEALSGLLIATALVGAAAPSVIAGASFLEVLTGTLEVIVDGTLSILDAIVSIFGSLSA